MKPVVLRWQTSNGVSRANLGDFRVTILCVGPDEQMWSIYLEGDLVGQDIAATREGAKAVAKRRLQIILESAHEVTRWER